MKVTKTTRMLAAASAVITVIVIVGLSRVPSFAQVRFKAGLTMSANQPYIADKVKLQFYAPTEVMAGGEAYENYASFPPYKNAVGQAMVRLGIKNTPPGQSYAVDCLVGASGSLPKSEFEMSGDGLFLKFPATTPSQHLTFKYQTKSTPWSWITISANVGWTFHSCELK
jgi:hypothetical protein